MKSDRKESNRLDIKPIPSWVKAEIGKISNSFTKISDCLRTVFTTDVVSDTNISTHNKLKQIKNQPFNNDDSISSIEQEHILASKDNRNLDVNNDINNESKYQLPQFKQENRLKSNFKKRIALGRICTVKCICNDQIIKGYLVTFKYYNIKLTFGPLENLKDVQILRLDARDKLFKLNISKQNSRQVVSEFYSKFKSEMELKYPILTIYHKECN